MKLKPISKEAQRTAAEAVGAKPLPKDHPNSFRRTVDHVLVPYAKATVVEVYRLYPERSQKQFGLTKAETEYIRGRLRLKSGKGSR